MGLGSHGHSHSSKKDCKQKHLEHECDSHDEEEHEQESGSHGHAHGGHGHSHGHSHSGHGHGHSHEEGKFCGCCHFSDKMRISSMLGMTLLFFFVELIAGQITKSISLTTDAFHMLSDALALVIGLFSIIVRIFVLTSSGELRHKKNFFKKLKIFNTLYSIVQLEHYF